MKNTFGVIITFFKLQFFTLELISYYNHNFGLLSKQKNMEFIDGWIYREIYG